MLGGVRRWGARGPPPPLTPLPLFVLLSLSLSLSLSPPLSPSLSHTHTLSLPLWQEMGDARAAANLFFFFTLGTGPRGSLSLKLSGRWQEMGDARAAANLVDSG